MALIPNIILFGASGCGKSSIINMLNGSDIAKTSSGAIGCTFESQCYQISFSNQTFNIYDTAGLEEAEKGSVPNTQAILRLYDVLRSLESGVNLLIFCMRAPRMSESAPKNWILFKDIICDAKVPTVAVITALENLSEQPGGMDTWWFKNKNHFEKFGMVPRGHACITTIRGKQVRPGLFAYGQEYDESKEKMMRLVMDTSLVVPWRVPRTQWFQQIVHTTYESRYLRDPIQIDELRTVVGPGIQKLVNDCKMSAEEATALATELDH